MYNYKAKMSKITATNVDLNDINDFIEEYFNDQLENGDEYIHLDEGLIESKCSEFIASLFDNSSGMESFDAWTDKYFNVDKISARLLIDMMNFCIREDFEDENGIIKSIREIFNAYAFRFVISNVDEIFLDKFKESICKDKTDSD